MTFQSQGEGFHALQEQEGVEGGDGGAGISKEDGPDVGGKGCGSRRLHEGNSVVAGIGVGDGRVFAAGLPVEFSGVHDDAAQGGAVPADELGGRVDHDVGAVLDGADQVGGAEGIVDDQGQPVPVGDGGDGVDIGDVAVRVSKGLQIDGPRVVLDGVFHLCQVVGIHEGCRDAVMGEGVLHKVVTAAVNGLLGDDVAAVGSQGKDGVGDGGGPGSHGQRSHAAFQCGQALFQHLLGGIGQAAVNVSGVGKAEAGGRMGGIFKYVGSGLINGNRPGIRGGIRFFLSDM